MPSGIGIIDTLIGFRVEDVRSKYDFMRAAFRDKASAEEFTFPVEYIFKDLPGALEQGDDPVQVTLDGMDRFGIEIGLVPSETDTAKRALQEHPDRFLGTVGADPNRGMDGVRHIRRMHDELGIRAVAGFPAGLIPQVPLNDRRWYPIYATCAELGLPIFITAGIPGPRVPYQCQYVGLLDEVCYDFPELTIVTRHGCEPWADLAVKLMLKWPHLYFSTSAFAPKHYPPAVIDYANTRGADKVIYAGYYPMALTLERIFADMEHVPFKDHVWPKFLRDNARTVLKLDPGPGGSGR